MIESPIIQELVAEKVQDQILSMLQARFGSVPQEISTALRRVPEESRLEELTDCPWPPPEHLQIPARRE